MRISDWSSDVCSSDLQRRLHDGMAPTFYGKALRFFEMRAAPATFCRTLRQRGADIKAGKRVGSAGDLAFSRQHRPNQFLQMSRFGSPGMRSEENTSELQSLMRISYASFCLKKTTLKNTPHDPL